MTVPRSADYVNPDKRRQVVVPLDDAWPMHCQQGMWFRGGEHPKFYCDCGHERAPLPSEVEVRSV